MTNEDKIDILKSWEKSIKDSEAFIERVESIFGQDESDMHRSIWSLQTELTRMTAKLIGDDFDWLGWYQFENGFGEKNMEAGIRGDMRVIKTLEDLLWVIQLQD
jgi:hypothetical protein